VAVTHSLVLYLHNSQPLFVSNYTLPSGWVGECFFWYRLTWIVPDKIQGAIKRLCVCYTLSSTETRKRTNSQWAKALQATSHGHQLNFHGSLQMNRLSGFTHFLHLLALYKYLWGQLTQAFTGWMPLM